MERIYKQIRLKELTYPDYSGVICGYVENMFILATLSKTDKSFRKFDKRAEPFIEEQYKDHKFRYVWADEAEVIKQHPEFK